MTCVWWPGMGVFCMLLLRVKFCGKYIGEAWSLLWNGRSLSSEGIKLTRFCDQCGTVGSDVGVPTCTLWCIELPSAQFLPDARGAAYRQALGRVLQQQVASSVDRCVGVCAGDGTGDSGKYAAKGSLCLRILLLGVPSLSGISLPYWTSLS